MTEGVHGVLVRAVVAPCQADEVEEDAGGVGVAAPLQLEVAEAHVAQALNLRRVEGEYAVFGIREQGVQAAAAVARLPFVELIVVRIQEVLGLAGEGVVRLSGELRLR